MKIEDDRFWKRVWIDPISHCWNYIGAKNNQGYGRVRRRAISQKSWILAHRYAFYLKHGRFPNEFACHICDNPPCVNPDHLFEGGASDNQSDSWKKGRAKLQKLSHEGESNGNAKLTTESIEQIKSLFSTMNNKQIAARYGVTHHAISKIRTGKNWK